MKIFAWLLFGIGVLATGMVMLAYTIPGFNLVATVPHHSVPLHSVLYWQKTAIGRVEQVDPQSGRTDELLIQLNPDFKSRIPRESVVILPEKAGKRRPAEHKHPLFLELKVMDPTTPALKSGDGIRVRPLSIDRVSNAYQATIERYRTLLRDLPARLKRKKQNRYLFHTLRALSRESLPSDAYARLHGYWTHAEQKRFVDLCNLIRIRYRSLSRRYRRILHRSILKTWSRLSCPDATNQSTPY